eukprot:763576-Hanusia_phi.AAC.7
MLRQCRMLSDATLRENVQEDTHCLHECKSLYRYISAFGSDLPRLRIFTLRPTHNDYSTCPEGQASQQHTMAWGRVSAVACIMLMAAALGGYHIMMKRYEQDAIASSLCEKNATAAKDLQRENAQLVAKLDKLTKQYEKLLAYMKEKCDTGGDPSGRMNSLCSTELDICKGNLVEARAELKACNGYAEKIDDKNLQLKQNLTKIKAVGKRILGEEGALIDKLMRSNFSRAEKDKQLKAMIEKNLDDEESQLSSIFKSNGINLGRKNIDFLSKLPKNRSTSETNLSKVADSGYVNEILLSNFPLLACKCDKFGVERWQKWQGRMTFDSCSSIIDSDARATACSELQAVMLHLMAELDALQSLPLPLQPLARQVTWVLFGHARCESMRSYRKMSRSTRRN